MFGGLRFVLATLVVLSHFSGSSYVEHFGYYAVRTFYCLSGFVVTHSLNEVYYFDLKIFWINRLLRLLPLYYLVAFSTLAVVLCLPTQAAEFVSFWSKASAGDIWANLALLPLQYGGTRFRLIMPAWSVAVEMTIHVFLCLIFSRSKTYAGILLLFGVMFHVYSLLCDHPFSDRYFSLQSATLSFGLGAVAYFWTEQDRLHLSRLVTFAVITMWLANMALGGSVLPESYVYGPGYYVSILLSVLLIVALVDWQPGRMSEKIDRRLGELAYPMFLSHWLIGFLVSAAFWPVARGWLFTLAVAPVLLGCAAALAVLNCAWIEPVRRTVRLRASRREALLTRSETVSIRASFKQMATALVSAGSSLPNRDLNAISKADWHHPRPRELRWLSPEQIKCEAMPRHQCSIEV